MTSEEQSHTVQADEQTTTADQKNEPTTDILSNPNQPITVSEEAPITKVDEEEEANVEKPKRGGRKKKETLDNDNAMDTQPLFEQPVIIEGKRSRKPTARLELSELEVPKKELAIPQGHGKPLGDIQYVDYQITHASTDVLSRLRSICFGRRGGGANVQKNLREFNGFEFDRDGEEYHRHLSSLTKLKSDQLQSLTDVLGLSTSGSNAEQATNILHFLMEPIDEGKQLPERKASLRNSQKASTSFKESLYIDDEKKSKNGDHEEEEDEEAEIFDEEEDDDEEEVETDDDYIGSDEESSLMTKDDPDDFVYQPGKKTPKKRSPVKRSRSRTTAKRKRSPSKPTKRGRKRPQVSVKKAVENENISAATEPEQTNKEESEQANGITSTTAESKNDDSDQADTNVSEQNNLTLNSTAADVTPATS